MGSGGGWLIFSMRNEFFLKKKYIFLGRDVKHVKAIFFFKENKYNENLTSEFWFFLVELTEIYIKMIL